MKGPPAAGAEVGDVDVAGLLALAAIHGLRRGACGPILISAVNDTELMCECHKQVTTCLYAVSAFGRNVDAPARPRPSQRRAGLWVLTHGTASHHGLYSRNRLQEGNHDNAQRYVCLAR